jgi:histidinol-phosphate aminotransferase
MVKPCRFVEELDPYKITPQDVWSESAADDILKLDWNEAPHDLDFYREELHRIVDERGIIAWYSDYLALELTDSLSIFLGIDSNLILTFPGSDVGLETICRAYLEVGDTAVALCPTYENFFVYALQTGARLEKIDLPLPFRFDPEIFLEQMAACAPVKLVYLVCPNNPCGYVIPCEILELLARKFPSTMFIVDEAYIEFAECPSSVQLVATLDNIVVVRTFSKAFGMAGLRLGYLCASLEVINTINKIRNGKNISMLSQRLGLHALRNLSQIQTWISQVKHSRDRFCAWCINNGVRHYPSEGNFVLFEARRPNELCSHLKSMNIYIRNRNVIIPNCVRASMGSILEVDRLIKALGTAHEYL